jgi:hypothetical protein
LQSQAYCAKRNGRLLFVTNTFLLAFVPSLS